MSQNKVEQFSVFISIFQLDVVIRDTRVVNFNQKQTKLLENAELTVTHWMLKNVGTFVYCRH